jgi:Endonuclease/Exonuclease/phosphatase family
VLAGDYNVVPTDLDIYSTKSWDRNALLQPESRAAYQRLLTQGWTDAVRALRPKEPMYTFWDYMRNRWERDGGLRLDHILLSSTLTERLQGAGVDRQTRGIQDASDHAPVWVRLRDGPDRRGNLVREVSGKTIAAGTTAAPKTKPSTHRTGDGTGRKRRPARIGQPALSARPLLVTATPSPIAHTTHCRKPFAAATARARALSLASRTSCCASTRTSSPGRLSLVGIAWGRRRNAKKCFPLIRAGESSMMI